MSNLKKYDLTRSGNMANSQKYDHDKVRWHVELTKILSQQGQVTCLTYKNMITTRSGDKSNLQKYDQDKVRWHVELTKIWSRQGQVTSQTHKNMIVTRSGDTCGQVTCVWLTILTWSRSDDMCWDWHLPEMINVFTNYNGVRFVFTCSCFFLGLMSYERYLCLFVYNGVQHILCCGFFSFCVPYVASFSRLSIFYCHLGIL